jgi:tetratricopeptide (TPR) repeat protein
MRRSVRSARLSVVVVPAGPVDLRFERVGKRADQRVAYCMTDQIDRLWTRARRYLAQGDLAPAIATLDSMRARAPGDPRTHLVAAQIAWRNDDVRGAAREALEAAGVAAQRPEGVLDIAEVLLLTGEVAAAHACLERLAGDMIGSGETLVRYADLRQQLGEHDESVALLDRAVQGDHPDSKLHFYRAQQLAFLGRLDDAEAEYKASLDLAPSYGRAALPLVRLRRQTAQGNHLERLEKGLVTVAPGSRDHAAFEFARYKVLEDLQRYADAWTALASANAIMAAQSGQDVARQHMALQGLYDTIAEFPPRQAQTTHEGPQPIFVIGLPRSGTTVLERLAGNHTDVVSAGELASFGQQLRWAADHRHVHDRIFAERLGHLDWAELGRRYLAQTQWRAGGKRRFIDKQPVNWMVAGWMHAALPGARILHMVRDPMDACFSNYRAMFGDAYSWSYRLDALAQHYHDYRRFMARWHALVPGAILDVSYAGLVSNTEGTMREVLDFCGLPWEPACTDLNLNRGPVSTLSAAQVHEPLHARSLGAWRHYEEHLAGLSRAISGTPATTSI